MVQCMMNLADALELPRQALTVFAWSSKEHVVLLILVEDDAFSVD